MSILVLGINHKTAPVQIRSRVSFQPEQMPVALRALADCPGLTEVALVSTCNRTELYVMGDACSKEILTEWLGNFHNVPPLSLNEYVYCYRDERAIEHVSAVACGLDSLVLGEPQILGQLKQAYNYARESGVLGTRLDKLFQHAFSVAKRVRNDTDIGASAVSVAYAAVSLSKQIFPDFAGITALLIGAGETIELVSRHLQSQGVTDIIVANRSLDRAQRLASEFNGRAITLSEIGQALPAADVVISSTGSPLPIVGKGIVESAIRQRKHKPVFMVDLAVPSDIEKEVAELSDVYLYTVDDLEDVIQENVRAREAARSEAMAIVHHCAAEYCQWLKSLDGVDAIREFRSQFEQIRDQELKRALAQFKGGDTEQAMRELANRLTNKFLHHPTRYLHSKARSGDSDGASKIRQIFELDKTNIQE